MDDVTPSAWKERATELAARHLSEDKFGATTQDITNLASAILALVNECAKEVAFDIFEHMDESGRNTLRANLRRGRDA